MKVKCDSDCKHRNDKGECLKEEVKVEVVLIDTMWRGEQKLPVCDGYEIENK